MATNPIEGQPLISAHPDRLYRCPKCRDLGFVAGREWHRHGMSAPTARACQDCDLGRGIKSRELADAERLKAGPSRASGRRLTMRERLGKMVHAGTVADPEQVKRPEWYDDEPEPDLD